jgi:hypothetical protein
MAWVCIRENMKTSTTRDRWLLLAQTIQTTVSYRIINIIRHNISSTDHVFCFRQALKRSLDCDGALHRLFIDFEKAFVSVNREVLFNILTEFCIPMKLVTVNKIF